MPHIDAKLLDKVAKRVSDLKESFAEFAKARPAFDEAYLFREWTMINHAALQVALEDMEKDVWQLQRRVLPK